MESITDWASQVVLVGKTLPGNSGDIRNVGSTKGGEPLLE